MTKHCRGWISAREKCTGAIHSIAHIIEDHAQAAGYPIRFAATKLVEGDEPMFKALDLDSGDIHIIDHIVEQMEQDLGTDREAALADMRYATSSSCVRSASSNIRKPVNSSARRRLTGC